ncbi:MAG: DUF6064 family protein [Alphaproteobacteria bacterium]
MRDWGNYELSDLLLFTKETYYRQFELYNEAIWPAQLAALAAGLAILALIRWRPAGSGRMIVLLLAAAWAGPAFGYFFTRHAFINWVAPYYGWAFIVEAALLLLLGAALGRLTFRTRMSGIRKAGLVLFAFALLVQPLLGLPAGRPLVQAELFAVMPDPTAVATLGLLLAADRVRWLLLIVPMLWCAIAGLTLWEMDSNVFFVPPAAAILVLVLAIGRAMGHEAQGRSGG